jgi:hypothetical protein
VDVTRELLVSLGAELDPVRGGLVIEWDRFKLVFLKSPSDPSEATWDVLIKPTPARPGNRAYEVRNTGDLFCAIFAAGVHVGQEDLRRKFRDIMELAESDLTCQTDLETPWPT